MIWYRNPNPNAPKLHWRKPFISERDKLLMRQENPPAVPGHCKPWIDGQSAGLVIPWTGKDVTLKFNDSGLIHKDLPATLMIHAFAEGHFSIQPGYFLHTQQNVGLYITSHPESDLVAVTGVVETDWYPMMPFYVFKNPINPRNTVRLKYGDPIALAIPIVLDKGLAEMTDEQFGLQNEDAQQYVATRMERTDLLWVSNRGQGFSKLYKEISRNKKRE